MNDITGDWLKTERLALCMSQPLLAHALGTSVSSVRNWEQKRRPLPAWVVVSIQRIKASNRLAMALTGKRRRRGR